MGSIGKHRHYVKSDSQSYRGARNSVERGLWEKDMQQEFGVLDGNRALNPADLAKHQRAVGAWIQRWETNQYGDAVKVEARLLTLPTPRGKASTTWVRSAYPGGLVDSTGYCLCPQD